MKREILFRGKRIDNGEWIYGDLIKNSKVDCFTYIAKGIGYKVDDYEIGTPIKVFPNTVGQYTGLTDKNGKKIFEGDILLLEDVYRGIVSYEIPLCGFAIYNFAWSEWTNMEDRENNVEVIGNIHDNPELKEVGE